MNNPFGHLLQQAQSWYENMQKEMQQLEVVGEAGAGMVRVTLDGHFGVKAISLDETVPLERPVIEELIAAAMNDAVSKLTQTKRERFGHMAGQMGGGIPSELFNSILK